jgi:hypothetical protein
MITLADVESAVAEFTAKTRGLPEDVRETLLAHFYFDAYERGVRETFDRVTVMTRETFRDAATGVKR